MTWQEIYAAALNGLPLPGLYREQDLYERRAERWARTPGGESQVAVAQERAGIIQAAIDKTYCGVAR